MFTHLSFLRSGRALLAALIWALLALRAAAQPPPTAIETPEPERNAASTEAGRSPGTVLGEGDKLTIQVYGQPDMAGTVSVGDDGTIPVALVGPVPVAGLAPQAAAQRVEKALRDAQLINDPHVTITVTQSASRHVSVLGEVGHPGRYPIDAQTGIMDVLALAGGAKESGADVIYLLRANAQGGLDRYPIDLKGLEDPTKPIPAQSLSLEPGDQVFVPKAPTFTIYGEVRTPNKYRIDDNMSVEDAIARAGGIKETGSTRRIEVERREGDGKTHKIKVRLSDPVKPDDVIHVKESIF